MGALKNKIETWKAATPSPIKHYREAHYICACRQFMRTNVTTRSSLIAVSRVVPTLGSSLTFISGEINRYRDDNLSLYKLLARFIKIRGCKLNFLLIKVHIRVPLIFHKCEENSFNRALSPTWNFRDKHFNIKTYWYSKHILVYF